MWTPALIIAACIVTAVVAGRERSCHYRGAKCEWVRQDKTGRCVDNDMKPDGFNQRLSSTRFNTIRELCSDVTDGVNPGADCCDAYGTRCALGYEELWCQDFPLPPQRQVFVEEEPRMCWFRGKKCRWFGTAPTCGGTEFAVGEWNLYDSLQPQLVMTTQDTTWTKLCSEANSEGPGEDCCTMEKYGKECISGYKRLWCYE
ncbi:hypothetical protein XA68_15307 [Ophiocordyceps unilateralis]|uniref:Hydrophobin n=1 Tax=Ophiocordyceps unilateralis TaxID=268505 RepID=A0A2A9P7T7_OPHUN|nr:hypothetical protein XA68_15307 [Ophiocordyceps unilateralis]